AAAVKQSPSSKTTPNPSPPLSAQSKTTPKTVDAQSVAALTPPLQLPPPSPLVVAHPHSSCVN
ncbi:hypothetical protein HK102_009673, partial [Quaeritorhiza haematococci]